MVDFIDIRRLDTDGLARVVEVYPWYGGARRQLCMRLAENGHGSDALYADSALYLFSRQLVTALAGGSNPSDFSDEAVGELLRREISHPQVIVVGGDYYSQSEYDKVRRSDDGIFSSFATSEGRAEPEEYEPDNSLLFCTETLAQVYREQGYYDKAREIYSKLSLRYPEKSVYFAALIEKLDNKQ